MPALTISTAVVLGYLAACEAAHPEVKAAPPRRVLAHAIGESALHVFALHDNTTDERKEYPTAEEAIASARDRLARGHRIDAGIMQVTDSNWRAYGLTLQTVFDPAANICAGARILAEDFRSSSGGRRVGTIPASRFAPIMPMPSMLPKRGLMRSPLLLPLPLFPMLPVAPPLCAPAWDGMALAHCNARRAAVAYPRRRKSTRPLPPSHSPVLFKERQHDEYEDD